MTHRGPFQPRPFYDSMILWDEADDVRFPNANLLILHIRNTLSNIGETHGQPLLSGASVQSIESQ